MSYKRKPSRNKRRKEENRLENLKYNSKRSLRNLQQHGNINTAIVPNYSSSYIKKPSTSQPITSSGKITIGKYKNKNILTVKNLQYLEWFRDNVTMNQETKSMVVFQIKRLS